jgi:hypothetical protein
VDLIQKLLLVHGIGGEMDDGDGYLMSGAATDLEGERLRHLQVGGDPFTFRHLEQTGVGEGWRCLEVGAGGGSVARWLGELFKRWRAAGVIDAVLGRRLPGLVGALGLDDIGVDVMTPTGGQGDSAYEVFRLAWPSARAAAAASGIAEADLQCVDEGFANSTMVVGMTTFAVWGRAVS